ncbi:DUF3331 domain-containing protein [Paraburkholderia sp. 1N]|uniref:DUF3331 domain-containing protein n=1 Tax=Paraburkholderia solitsugae TaxID=2675748 RepID=A0ABX2BQ90_9BURK|nr:DUF3331 domain-containing protein [Paraburkholderia solitsugae]
MYSRQSPAPDMSHVHIEILERSDTTLTLRWVEPGRCHYGEQGRRCAKAWLRGSPAQAVSRVCYQLQRLPLSPCAFGRSRSST